MENSSVFVGPPGFPPIFTPFSALRTPSFFTKCPPIMVPLAQTRLFSALTPAELQAIRQSSQERKLPANSLIFKEGDPGDGLYIISEGQVQISAIFQETERRVLGRLGPG